MWRFMPLVVLKLVLPATLLFCCTIRPCVISLAYGVLFLLWPFCSRLSANGEIQSRTRTYAKISLATSTLALLAQSIFYGLTFAYLNDGGTSDCEKLLTILRAIGLQRPTTIGAFEIVRHILPDLCCFFVCLVTLLLCLRYEPRRVGGVVDELGGHVTNALLVGLLGAFGGRKPSAPFGQHLRHHWERLRLTELCSLALLALCGVVYPSLISSVYFLSFLALMTYWSMYLPVNGRTFNFVKIALFFYSALHLTILYVVQLEIVQKVFDMQSLAAKIVGLPVMLNSTCTNETFSGLVLLNPLENWAIYLYPGALVAYFVCSAFQYQHVHVKWRPNTPSYNENRCETALHCDDLTHPDVAVVGAPPQQAPESLTPTVAAQPGAASPTRLFSFDAVLRDMSPSTTAMTSPKRPPSLASVSGCLALLIRHSYALSLMSMMAWAIVYHCWLSFIWLILACLAWLTSDSRAVCLKMSPFVVAYATFLLCCEYAYGIRSHVTPLLGDVWPEETPKAPLLQIGFITPTGPACIPLLAKLCFSVPFWILLRVFLRENRTKKRNLRQGVKSSFSFLTANEMSTTWVGRCVSKFWIYVVALNWLLISLRQPVVVYTVLYMVFFLVFTAVFQLSFRIWRLMLFGFWSLLVFYSIAILLIVYTYQFHDVPSVWRNWTGWESNNGSAFEFKDLGLVEYDSAYLFVQLLTPISFLVVVILQLKFFHTEFMHITDVKHYVEESFKVQESSHGVNTEFLVRTSLLIEKAKKTFWKAAELHISKLVAFSLILLSIYEVAAVNFVLVVVVSVMLLSKKLHLFLSIFANLLCSAIIIVKMLFHMNFISGATISVDVHQNCSIFFNQKWHNIDPAKWTGFEKSDNVASYLKGYLIVCSLLTFQSIVRLRRSYRQTASARSAEFTNGQENLLFPGIERAAADESIKKCLMFLANYWFRQFGQETCYIVMVIGIGIRMDAAAMIYSIWLLVLLCLPQYALSKIWRLFVVFLAIFVPLQYALCVALPPSQCTQYLLSSPKDGTALAKFLPQFDNRGAVQRTSIDTQDIEANWAFLTDEEKKSTSTVNPVPNFIIYTKSYLDMVKICIFSYFHWFTLIVIFAAGFGRISVFAFGYLVAAFCLLWKGNDLYLQSFNYVRVRWYLLLIYNVLSILLKVFLQIAGCGYLRQLCENRPIVIKLFSIACLSVKAEETAYSSKESQCYVPPEEPEILYDGVCFAFLMIQMQIFHSWYFKHSVASFKSQRILSARGAVVISHLITTELNQQDEREKKALTRLVKKTSKIRDQYLKKLCSQKSTGSTLYYESIRRSQIKSSHMKDSNNYWDGKRSGNYYMFEYETDSEEEIENEPPSELTSPLDESEQPDALGPLQLAHMVIARDFDLAQTVEECKGRLHRLSVISGVRSQHSLGTLSELAAQSERRTDDELAGLTRASLSAPKVDEAVLPLAEVIFELRNSSGRETPTDDAPWKTGEAVTSSSHRPADGSISPENFGGTYDSDVFVTSRSNVVDVPAKGRRAASLRRSPAALARMKASGSSIPRRFDHEGSLTPAVYDAAADGRVSRRQQSDGGRTMTAPERPIDGADVGNLATSSKYSVGPEAIPPTCFGSFCRKCSAFFIFLQMFGASFLEWSLREFNKISRDCRYVACVLKNENKWLMETLGDRLEADEADVRSLQRQICHQEIGRRIRKAPTAADIQNIEVQVLEFEKQHNVVIRFLISLNFLLFSRSDLLCYAMMILDHMSNGALISLPLPLFAFFWGTLCSPRPPKFFWVTVITYTEAMIVIKFIFQFDFFPSKFTLNDPFHPVTVIGLEKSNNFVAWDVALLMVLFFHRYILKMLGLWKDLKPDMLRSATLESRYSSTVLGMRSSKIDAHNGAVKSGVADLPGPSTQRHAMDEDLHETVISQAHAVTPAVDINGQASDRTPIDECHLEIPLKSSKFHYFWSIVSFYKRLFRPEYHYITDMYSLMFLCDLVCFLILAFGYSSFGVAAEKGDVVSDIKSNKVPLPFVAMLIALMVLIIVDRGIYLRKSVLAKLIFQYLLVISVHVWIFFALPAITDIPINNNVPAQLWYFVKCVYFLLSAWQIKNGYRSKRYGNALTKHYNLLNYCFFTGFMAAPFLFELRTLVDWIWTQTGMPLFDYFSMENIYATIYRLKCMRKMEKDFPVIRGEAQGAFVKYGIGFPILLFIVVLIWLPLLLFALVNSIGRGLLPISAKFTISLKGYPPIYEAIAEEYPALSALSPSEYSSLAQHFPDKRSVMFLRDYDVRAVQKVTFNMESDTTWSISVPSRKKLLENLKNSSITMSIVFKWEFTRPRESSEKEPATQSSSHTVFLNSDSELKDQLHEMIDQKSPEALNNRNVSQQLVADSSVWIRIDHAFPPYVELPSYGEVQPVTSMLETLFKSTSNATLPSTFKTYSSIGLRMTPGLFERYWSAVTMTSSPAMTSSMGDGLQMTVFVDKVFPSALEVFTSKGIIGVYVVVVLAAGRFMRSLVVTSPLEILITEMPSVDRILQLCLDIYLVREAKDFFLELDLFAKLIFLIRSPETLIKWTRPKTS